MSSWGTLWEGGGEGIGRRGCNPAFNRLRRPRADSAAGDDLATPATLVGEAGDGWVVRGEVGVEALARGAAWHAAGYLLPEVTAVRAV